MNKFNSEQKAAINSTHSHLRIIAGAGSGKTSVLIERYRNLVTKKNVDFFRVLIVVFNKNAQIELLTRSADFVTNRRMAWIHTYHSFCFTILRHELTHLGWDNNFESFSPTDQRAIIKNAMKEINLKDPSIAESLIQIKTYDVLEYISAFKYKHIMPISELLKKIGEVKKNANKVVDRLKAQLSEAYLKAQLEKKCLDFDDYICYIHYLFRTFPEILSKYANNFDHVLMDEFQDIDKVQYEIFCMLCKNGVKNIFFVGDPDQCIYEWRRANVDIILRQVEKDFPDLETIVLNQNYRSKQPILDVANTIIKKNKNRLAGHKKQLITSQKGGNKVQLKYFNYVSDEANYVSQKIQSLVDAGTNKKEIAIIYRLNSLTTSIEKSLIEKSIDYHILSNFSFFDRLEVKAAFAYSKLLFNSSTIQFEYIINKPSRKIGPINLEKIAKIAKLNNLNFFELCFNNFNLLEKSNHGNIPPVVLKELKKLISTIKKYQELFLQYIENMKKNKIENKEISTNLLICLKDYLKETGLTDYIGKIATDHEDLKSREKNLLDFCQLIITDILENDNEMLLHNNILECSISQNSEKSNDQVILSTIHGVKGLEFEHVFLIGFAQGIFPSSYKYNDEDLEEERRLAYVAYTRAKNNLYLSYHVQASGFLREKNLFLGKSVFLKESGIK